MASANGPDPARRSRRLAWAAGLTWLGAISDPTQHGPSVALLIAGWVAMVMWLGMMLAGALDELRVRTPGLIVSVPLAGAATAFTLTLGAVVALRLRRLGIAGASDGGEPAA